MTSIPAATTFTDSGQNNGGAKQAQEDILSVLREMVGGSAESALTIATGAATPTAACHAIDTEAAASADDLANLATTNHPDGRFLLIRAANAAHVVTVKHNAGGAGQIALYGSSDVVLDSTSKWLLLKRTGSNWEEVGRMGFPAGDMSSDGSVVMTGHLQMGAGKGVQFEGTTDDSFEALLLGGDPTADRTINLPDVSGTVHVTGKGADIASASPLVLGRDGHYFVVTGTTGFSSVTVEAGRLFSLQFAGVLTLTHGASLNLPGAANITTAAGDEALCFATAANTVRVLAYTKADGTPIVSGGGGSVGYQVSSASDISITSNISTLTAYTAVGSPFTMNIPAKGIIELSGYLRVANDAANYTNFFFGIRIGATNYWPLSYNDNGSAQAPKFMTFTNSNSVGAYWEGPDIVQNHNGAKQLFIEKQSIPTGAQTVQLICSTNQGNGVIKGTVTPMYIDLLVQDYTS